MAVFNINLNDVQPTLVSGTNIKTINGNSILGSGDLVISTSVNWGGIGGTLSAQTDLQSALDAKQATLVSGTNIKTINGTTLLGSGDLVIAAGVAIGDAVGSGTAGSILYLGAGGVLAQDNANFFIDNTNKRVGFGVNTGLTARVQIKGASGEDAFKVVNNSNGNLLTITNGGVMIGNFSSYYSITAGGSFTTGTYVSQTGFSTNGAITSGTGSGKDAYLWVGSEIGGLPSKSIIAHFQCSTSVKIGLVVQGATSQTANLTEWRNVGGTVLSYVSSLGHFDIAASTTAQASLRLRQGFAPTTSLSGDLWWNGAVLGIGVGGGFNRAISTAKQSKITDTTVANTTTETELYSVPLSPNSFAVGQQYVVRCNGYYSTNSGSDFFTIRFKLNGSTVLTVVTNAKNVTNKGFDNEFTTTIRTIGGSGTLIAFGKTEVDTDSFALANSSTTAIDTGASNTMSITVEWNAASAGNTMTCTQGILRILDGLA